MLKKFYILALIFGLQSAVFNLYSQPSIQWQWLYPGPYDLDDEGQDICESTDGNFFLVGTSFGFNYFANYYVIKIDPLGQIIWKRALGGTNGMGSAFAVAPTLGGGCVVTGGAARFLKFNANGDTVSNKVINDSFERRIFNIKRTSDNNYIACGRYNITNALIIKFDSLGNFIWEKKYPSPYIKLLYAVEEGIDGGYIAVGRNQNFFNDPLKLLIIKVAENGDSLWIKEYGNFDGVTLNKLNSNYIISGQRYINKIDINGNMYSTFPIDSIQLSEQVKDFKILSANRYVFVTNDYRHADTTYSKIMMSDSNGNMLRIKKINFSNYVYLNKVQICNNSDMIFMGFAAQYDTSSKWQYYALRTDSLFNFPPVNVIGIEQLITVVPSKFQLHQNYPNPFNPVTTIKFGVPVNSNVSIKIYDLLGREIFSINEYKTAGTHEIKFDGANYASGMYFYQLEAGNYKETKKMVLVK